MTGTNSPTLTAGQYFKLVASNTSDTNIDLPEGSNISIQFGTKLNLYGSLVRLDGRGFDPDLWVEPTHAIDYLVEALSKAW